MGFCPGSGSTIVVPAGTFAFGNISVPDINLQEFPAAPLPATAFAAATVSGDCKTMVRGTLFAFAGGERHNG